MQSVDTCLRSKTCLSTVEETPSIQWMGELNFYWLSFSSFRFVRSVPFERWRLPQWDTNLVGAVDTCTRRRPGEDGIVRCVLERSQYLLLRANHAWSDTASSTYKRHTEAGWSQTQGQTFHFRGRGFTFDDCRLSQVDGIAIPGSTATRMELNLAKTISTYN